ncbi:MAG: glycosyltransferase family 39 protein [Bacteroidia bacterium]|nr:glycosyltransferase family 39 protein [Bacteroidia bacterium]
MKTIFKNPASYFIFFLVAISLYYNYQSIAFKRPQSVHRWRQADCASLALNYYQDGMQFFKPQTHHLTVDLYKSGFSAPSEIPLMYYTVAILYKIFGFHDYIFRILNTFIYFLGLFYLFKFSYKILNNAFLSICTILLFFASPVLAYYGNNFLTDSTALSLGFIAVYHFYIFYKNNSNKHFYYSIIFFFLAGSCKISGLLGFTAIGAVVLFDLLRLTNIGLGNSIANNYKRFIIPVILMIGTIAAWILFAKKYNQIHNSTYFLTSICPIWDLDKAGIHDILHSMKNVWLDHYFHRYTLILLGLMLLFNIIYYKTKEKFLYLFNLFLFIGTIFFALLWFDKFDNHDYFLLNLYILPAITIVLFFSNLKQLNFKIFNSIFLKIAFAVFLLFNVYHTNRVLRVRYNGWQSDPTYHAFQSVSPYLHSIGIKDQDTVMCIPDETPASLYNMNLKGWSNIMGSCRDSVRFSRNIRNGAKYIIINEDISTKFPFALKYLSNKIGEYKNIKIYKIAK